MSHQQTQLAATVAVATTCDGVLVTDAVHRDLLSHEIEVIIKHGGVLRLSALSSADAAVLADIRHFIDQWHKNQLRSRTLCRRLKSSLGELTHLNPDWFDRLYAKVLDIWIVAFGKCPGRARASTTEKAVRDDFHGLLDEVEQLVLAPLRVVPRRY